MTRLRGDVSVRCRSCGGMVRRRRRLGRGSQEMGQEETKEKEKEKIHGFSPLGAPTPTFLQTFKLEPSTSEGTHNPHLCSTTTVRYLCTCVCVYWYRCTCGDRSWIGDIVGTSWPPVDDVSSEWGTILIFQDIVCV